jgi:hypothetical protein
VSYETAAAYEEAFPQNEELHEVLRNGVIPKVKHPE